MNSIRRLVSGNKARFVHADAGDGLPVDLDLVVLTDTMVLMGYPASGFESLYRNQRTQVLRFLTHAFPNYHIINLCPRTENEYSADFFNGRTSRFPFPDHHPPPLSLVRLAVEKGRQVLAEEKQVVIHCKAGKGRSGTVAICILLSYDALPSPATHPLVPKTATSALPAPPIDPTMADKIAYLLAFHKAARMAPDTRSQGVSIASQRRWIGYWGRILEGQDPRRSLEQSGRRIRLDYVRVTARGLKGVLRMVGGERVAVQVSRYRDSVAEKLRLRELAAEERAGAESPAQEEWNDDDWDDREEMIVPVGTLSAPAMSSSSSSSSLSTTPSTSRPSSIYSASSLPNPGTTHTLTTHHLVPSACHLTPSGTTVNPSRQGSAASSTPSANDPEPAPVEILLDPTREIQLSLLLGKNGRKHGKLPAMAALGVIWIVPCFETDMSHPPSGGGSLTTIKIGKRQVDFLKPQIGLDEVEIGWSWV